MNDEVDLRPYILELTQRWRWIIGITLLAVFGTFIASSLPAPVYEAQASLAITRSRTNVTLDPRIITRSEDESTMNVSITRRTALVALVASNDVANGVLLEVGEQLDPDDHSIADLLNQVNVSSAGDLIIIAVHHKDPEIAVLLANTWAQVYARYVNELFGTTDHSVIEVMAQVAAAREVYTTAQANLEEFLGRDRMAALEREISTQQSLLDTYQEQLTALQTQPINLALNSERTLLADYYEDLRQIQRWLADAQMLRNQVSAGQPSTASALRNLLAFLFLQSRTPGDAEPIQLQMDLNNLVDGEAVQTADIDLFIQVLETRRVIVQEQINALRENLADEQPGPLGIETDHPLNQQSVALEATIRALQVSLETERAQKRELEQARDMAWNIYQLMTRKQAEVDVASQTVGAEVKLATTAILPLEPMEVNRLRNSVVAGALGFMLAFVVFLVMAWWRRAMPVHHAP